MRNMILGLILTVLCANECNMPYEAKTIYKENKTDSNKLVLNNQLELTFLFSLLDWSHKIIGVAVICDLRNQSQTVQNIDRNQFTAISSHGIKFKMRPMDVANNFKVTTLPNKFPVAGGQKVDYVFIFDSEDKYSKQQGVDLLKIDTVFFLYHTTSGADTLFKLVYANRRIRQ